MHERDYTISQKTSQKSDVRIPYLTSCKSVGRIIGIVSPQRLQAKPYATSDFLSFSVDIASIVFVPRKGKS
jgi:hypothetical protein